MPVRSFGLKPCPPIWTHVSVSSSHQHFCSCGECGPGLASAETHLPAPAWPRLQGDGPWGPWFPGALQRVQTVRDGAVGRSRSAVSWGCGPVRTQTLGRAAGAGRSSLCGRSGAASLVPQSCFLTLPPRFHHRPFPAPNAPWWPCLTQESGWLGVVVRKRPSERAPEDVSSTDPLWSLSLCRLFWGATRTACEPGGQVLLSRGGSFLPRSPVCPHTEPAGGLSLLFPRNVLTESARIARGNITDLAKLSAANHDAAVFPGGFGAAKNLSTFAVDGGDCKVNKDVERVLKEFHQAGKPIGLCCIAPVLAAKVLRRVEVTVGHEQEEGGRWPHAGTAQVIKALGAKHCVTGVTEAHVDQKNKVVTTPAFMCDTAFHHIHDGVGAMAFSL
uniref:DJ-1/PfpI domain-containing protein n=1 Tax=Monodon monoceros TaxID=40151 RepID=A0A8C6AL79_MONMO